MKSLSNVENILGERKSMVICAEAGPRGMAPLDVRPEDDLAMKPPTTVDFELLLAAFDT